MNRHLTYLARRSPVAALVVSAALLFACGGALAHDLAGRDAESGAATISANEAKRMARRYLVEQGYSLRIGPGGARIQSVSRDGGRWVVTVLVSRGSSVQREQHVLYVPIERGESPPQLATR